MPLRAYALCIIAGIVAAIWITEKRWVARGGRRGTVSDVAVWAVVFGLVGGRLYHVVTDNELYFRAGRDPVRALYVWEGGLGIWGAIALGGVGAWIGCRRRGIKLPPFADAAAPGIAVAQAIGRWGNWFNQELFGRPTDLPWATGDLPGQAQRRPRRDDVPPDLPVRVAVVPGAGRPAGARRPAVPARARPGLRALRDGLHGRPGVDRAAPDRQREHRLRDPAERVDVDPGLRRRAGLLPAAPRAAGDRGRAPRSAYDAADGEPGRQPRSEPADGEPGRRLRHGVLRRRPRTPRPRTASPRTASPSDGEAADGEPRGPRRARGRRPSPRSTASPRSTGEPAAGRRARGRRRAVRRPPSDESGPRVTSPARE